jgi:hypothetical protein
MRLKSWRSESRRPIHPPRIPIARREASANAPTTTPGGDPSFRDPVPTVSSDTAHQPIRIAPYAGKRLGCARSEAVNTTVMASALHRSPGVVARTMASRNSVRLSRLARYPDAKRAVPPHAATNTTVTPKAHRGVA